MITMSLRTFCTVSEKTEFEITTQRRLENRVSPEPNDPSLSPPADRAARPLSTARLCVASARRSVFPKEQKPLSFRFPNPSITS